jgi:hypothetical protein
LLIERPFVGNEPIAPEGPNDLSEHVALRCFEWVVD